MKGVGISELLRRVGDENVRFQNLLEGDVDVTATKHGTRVTFYTDPANLNPTSVLHGSEMIGLVVWLPRNLVTRAMGEGK